MYLMAHLRRSELVWGRLSQLNLDLGIALSILYFLAGKHLSIVPLFLNSLQQLPLHLFFKVLDTNVILRWEKGDAKHILNNSTDAHCSHVFFQVRHVKKSMF